MTKIPLLSNLSMSKILEIDRRSAVCIQPIGAVEQHGPHLPVSTDALIAEHLARRAAERTTANAWVLPTLSYGTSGEHLGWAGTISLDTNTLLAVCRDVARSVRASGFGRLVFVNGHGGQCHLLSMAARDLRIEFGLNVVTLMPGQLGLPPGITVSDAEWGIHAGELETSLMLHLAPELVDMSAATIGGEAVHRMFTETGHLSIENGISPAWVTDDVSPDNGVIGDPLGADASIGAAVMEHQITRLAEALAEIAALSFSIPHTS